ncbi:MAG: hypothetical protein AB1762_20955, partial [Gemmatimonadota bacterium]
MTEPILARAATARPALQAVRAVVCAGGVETEYARAGRGEPLVLLVQDLAGDDVLAVMAVLTSSYLVYAATPPTDHRAAWLQNFMEGLGVP